MQTYADIMQLWCRLSNKCASGTLFCCYMPSVHRGSWHTLMHTFCRPMQTLCRHDAEYQICVQQFFLTVPWFFVGPTWCQRDWSVLVASRLFDGSRSRKTEGSLADTLRCNIWRRAQTPEPYGVGTAGAPKLVEQWFCCTKSAKSVHLAHLVHTFNQSVETNAYFKQTLQTLCADLKSAHSVQTKCILLIFKQMQTICTLQ